MSNSMRIMHFLIVPCIGFVLNKDAIIEDMYLICFVKECTIPAKHGPIGLMNQTALICKANKNVDKKDE